MKHEQFEGLTGLLLGLAASKASSSPKGGKIEQFSLAGLSYRFQAGCFDRAGNRSDMKAPGFAAAQTVLEMGLK